MASPSLSFQYPFQKAVEKKKRKQWKLCLGYRLRTENVSASVEMFWFIYRISSALIWNADPRIAHRPPAPPAMEEVPTRPEPTGASLAPALAGGFQPCCSLRKTQKMVTWITPIKIRTTIKLSFKNYWLLMLIYELWRLITSSTIY